MAAPHSAQGFSWLPGNVTFDMLSDVDHASVEIYRDEPLVPRPDAQRAIVLPPTVGPSGQVRMQNI